MLERTFYQLILALFLAAYLMAGLIGIQAHQDPIEMDTTAYLSAAYQIKETGGISHHIQNCLSGLYREATQHPAYLLTLSLVAENNIHFFVKAKCMTYLIGFLFLIIFFLITQSMFGKSEGLLGAGLLISSATFLNLTTMVACESLFALFFLLFWYFLVKGFKNDKQWMCSGFFASAAFLTKSAGIFTLPIFVFTCLVFSWNKKKNIFRNKYFFAFFAVFFILSAPLLIRNIKVYKAPLYSNSSAVLWLDRWRDYYRSDILEHPPTLSSYLKSHTPRQIASTLLKGIFVRDPQMISDGLKPFAFWERPMRPQTLQGFYERTVSWQEGWALALFLLSLWGLWKLRGDPAAWSAFGGLAFFLVFVGWYSKVFPGMPPTRLLYPVLFFVWIFAAKGLCDLLSHGMRHLSKLTDVFSKVQVKGLLPIMAGIFLAVYITSLLTNFDWNKLNIQRSYSFRNPFVSELRWVDQHVQRGDTIMVGTVFMSYLFYFEKQIRGKVLLWPQMDDLDRIKTTAKDQAVRYGILDIATVVYNMKVYQNNFSAGPRIGLQPVADLPPFYRKIYTDNARIPYYYIYEFSQSN